VNPKGRSGHFGEQKYLLFLPEIEPRFLGPLARGLVITPMRYPGSSVDCDIS